MSEPLHIIAMARPRKPSITLPEHVHRTVSRGKEYFTFQYGRGTKNAGPRIKLPHPLDPEFSSALHAAAGDHAQRPAAETFDALIEAYRLSPEWRQLSDASRRDYSRYLIEIARMWGDLRVGDFEASDALALRDRRSSKPAATNYLLRVLSLLISWGIPRGFRSDNPCAHVRKLKTGEGWEPWPWNMIERIRDGAPAELWHVATVALYTGQRQRDVLSMKWSDLLNDGTIGVVQEKTRTRLWIPIHRDLSGVLQSIPRHSVFLLTNRRGLPWTQDGFRTSWGKMCKRLAIDEQLVFHGLRKSAVDMLLEAGCTTAEVAAITGQSMQMVEHYAKHVNQRKLASSGMAKWENAK